MLLLHSNMYLKKIYTLGMQYVLSVPKVLSTGAPPRGGKNPGFIKKKKKKKKKKNVFFWGFMFFGFHWAFLGFIKYLIYVQKLVTVYRHYNL